MDSEVEYDIDEYPGTEEPNLSNKLLHRFYEPLGLVSALGKTRGEHTHKILPSHEQVDSFSALELKRQFLDELAFLCDYKKGGETVTAVALGQTPQGYIFWVAANKCPERRIVPFLTELLLLLKESGDQRDDQLLAGQIFELSVRFARARIATYARFLSSDLVRLVKFPACADGMICKLLAFPASENSTLMRAHNLASFVAAWKDKLDTLVDINLHSLVDFAYKNRHSIFVRRLATLRNERQYESSKDSLQATCASARHHIGRLDLHARSAQALALYTLRATPYLKSYSVRAVNVPVEGNVRPPCGIRTTVDAALGRMMPHLDPNLEMYRQAVAQMDGALNISKRFRRDYCDAKNKTRVHAEVQMIHHFDLNGGEFEGNDKYVACSKPACFCCLLYFRHHPDGYVEPRSHHKIYPNWQPPGAFKATESRKQTRLTAILNRMVEDIRVDALRQIVDKAGPKSYHPDSVTGISASVLALPRLDDVSNMADGSRELAEASSGDIEYDNYGSDNAVNSSAISQIGTDSDKDNEEGGISLL
jgi:hypothetical protein